VQVVHRGLTNLDAELLAELEPRVAAYAETVDPSRLKRTIRKWLLELDPTGQAARRKAAEQDRYVNVSANDDGTSTLDGILPVAGAQSLYERLREMATTQCCARDPRNQNQRRADALVALADGTGHRRRPGPPTRPPRPFHRVPRTRTDHNQPKRLTLPRDRHPLPTHDIRTGRSPPRKWLSHSPFRHVDE
jgi:hypothetical protein